MTHGEKVRPIGCSRRAGSRRAFTLIELLVVIGIIGVLLAACVSEGINYVQQLGLDKIRAHARQMTDRLQKELPPLGYKPLTPRGTETPIVAFELKDAAATAKALQAGKVNATIIANENRLRLSVSVFTTHEDIDRVVDVLGGRERSSAG